MAKESTKKQSSKGTCTKVQQKSTKKPCCSTSCVVLCPCPPTCASTGGCKCALVCPCPPSCACANKGNQAKLTRKPKIQKKAAKKGASKALKFS